MGIDQSYFAPLAVGVRAVSFAARQTRSEIDQVLRRQSLKQLVFFRNTLKRKSMRDLVSEGRRRLSQTTAFSPNGCAAKSIGTVSTALPLLQPSRNLRHSVGS
jgi:adenosylcobinamide amidohydrolase